MNVTGDESVALQKQLVTSEDFKKAFEDVTILGVAGTNASGKDTLMQFLGDSGFLTYNVGDALRQVTQAVMQSTQRGGNDSPTGKIANFQRAIYPGGMVSLGLIDYWARILHMPEEYHPKGLVIGSIRGVGEAQVLQEFGGKLIAVDADIKVRYKRVTSRSRDYESAITFEQFVAEEEGEMGRGETDPTKFGMAQVMGIADIQLDNSNSDINVFIEDVKEALKNYL